MLIHNNKFPRVSTFKEGQVEDVYVSRSETVGVLERAEKVIGDNHADIMDYVGYDPIASDIELIAEKADNTFERVQFNRVDGETVADSHLDTSMQDPKIISRNRQNDLQAVIRSDSDNTPWATLLYDGVENKIYNTVCLGIDEYNRSPQGTFNPYYRLKMTDIVKSFNISGEIYNIHRGGYISIVDTREKHIVNGDARIINFSENMPHKGMLELHDDRIFNKFQYSNAITGASFNGKDVILITSPNNLIIFNIKTHKHETVNGFSRDCVVIDIMAKGDKYYAILGTYKENVLSPILTLIDAAGQMVRIQPEGNIEFPNTIVSVGNHIVFYNKASKAFPRKTYEDNFRRSMSFLHYNEKTGKSGVFATSNILGASEVAISFIEGSSIDNVFVGINCRRGTKNHSILNNAILNVNKLTDVKLYLENQFNVGLDGQDVDSLFYNNHIYIHDKNTLEILKISGSKVIGSKVLEATLGRSTATSITGVSVVGKNVTILYNDNTHGLFTTDEMESMISSGLTAGGGEFRNDGCVVTCGNKTFILEDKSVSVMFDNNALTGVSSTHTYDIFDLHERDVIFKKCTKVTENDYFISLFTKSGRDIVCHAVKVNVSTALVEIESRHPATFRLNEEDKIIVSPHTGFDDRFITVPVMCATCKVFLIVYDLEEDITIINKIRDDDDYIVWKVPFCDERAEQIGMQIHGDIHRLPLLTNFFDGEDSVNGCAVNEHELQLLLDCSKEDFPLANLLVSTPLFDGNEFDKGIVYTNGVRVNDLIGPRLSLLADRIPHYAFIDNFFLKVYDDEKELVGIMPLQQTLLEQRISGVEHIGGRTYRIDTDIGVYYTINLDEIKLNQRITCTNLNVKYAYSSKGLYVFYDEYGVINLYDPEDGRVVMDILNTIVPTEDGLNQFRSDVNSGCRFKVNSVEKNHGIYYIHLTINPGNGTTTGSMEDIVNYYLLTLSVDKELQAPRLFYVGSSTTPGDEIINAGIISNIKTDFATFSLTTFISNALCFFYNDNTIKCRYLNVDNNELNADIYTIKTFDTDDVFLGLNSPERSKVDIYYINGLGDVTIESVDLDHIDDIDDPTSNPPSNTTKYRVLFRDESISLVNLIDGSDGLRFRHCNKNGTSYDLSYEDVKNPFERFPYMVGRTESSITLYGESNFITVGFEIPADQPFETKRGYSYYNYRYFENLFSDLLFTRFAYSGQTSCISTGGLSRCITDLHDPLKDRHIIGISDEIFISSTPVLRYNLNLPNCVKDVEYYQSARSESMTTPASTELFSHLVYKDNGDNRYINYTQLKFDECIAVTTCFDGMMRGGGEPDPDKSYSVEWFVEERTETNEGGIINHVVLSKEKNVDGAFSTIESINGDDSRFSEPGFDIWPLYCDEDGLHSVISKKDGSVTAFLTNVGTPEIIPDVTNFKTAVKIPGYDCIFLLTEDRLLTYDVKEKKMVGVGLKIKDLKNTVINLNTNYTPIHILKMTNNFRCNLLVKNNISGKLYVAPACRLVVTIVGQRVNITINADDFDVLESYDLVGNNYLNPYTSRDGRYITLNDNVLLKLSKMVKYTLTFTNVRTEKALGSVENPLLIYDFEAYRNEVKPSVFIAKNFWLLQRNNMIEIYRVDFDGHPHALPVFVIEQPYFRTLRVVTQFMNAGNSVMLAFNDGSCKEIRIDPSKKDSELYSKYNYSPDLYDVRPVFDVSNMTGLSYFITVYGVGFVANKSIHLFKEQSNDYVTIPTGKIRSYAVDYINNRVYIVDEDNNFGYVLVGGGKVDSNLNVIPKADAFDDGGRVSVINGQTIFPVRPPTDESVREKKTYYTVADSVYVPVNVLDALFVMNVTFNNQTFISFMTEKGLFIYLKDTIHKWVSVKLDNEKWDIVSPRNRKYTRTVEVEDGEDAGDEEGPGEEVVVLDDAGNVLFYL